MILKITPKQYRYNTHKSITSKNRQGDYNKQKGYVESTGRGLCAMNASRSS